MVEVRRWGQPMCWCRRWLPAVEAAVTEESGDENGALDVASKAVALARR